jgi:hypothetical protein
LRREARRYQFGAYLKGTGNRFRGIVSVWDIRIPVLRDGFRGWEVCVGPTLHNRSIQYHERAIEGAEKSCPTRRRKRGLRKGKSRSRVRHTRQILTQPATDSKAQSSRKVNHIGRKFIWAVKASNNLRKDCEKLNKFPRGQLPALHPAYAPRLKMKKFCLAKWTRLHIQAEASGIHPTASFHKSFWDYLMIETSRGDPIDGLDLIVGGLRLLKEESDREKAIASGSVYRTPPAIRRGRGGRVLPAKNKIRVCRRCGYGGPMDSHPWNDCGVVLGAPTKKNRGGPSRRR